MLANIATFVCIYETTLLKYSVICKRFQMIGSDQSICTASNIQMARKKSNTKKRIKTMTACRKRHSNELKYSMNSILRRGTPEGDSMIIVEQRSFNCP